MIPTFTPHARIYRPPVVLEPVCTRADLEALAKRGGGRLQVHSSRVPGSVVGEDVTIRFADGQSLWRVTEVRGASVILEAT